MPMVKGLIHHNCHWDLKMSVKDKSGGETEVNISENSGDYQHGKHPNSLSNLKPFEKGVSGNPGGKPMKFQNLKKSLDRWGKKHIVYDLWEIPEATDGQPLKEQVLFGIWDKARRGNIKCMELLARLGCLDD